MTPVTLADLIRDGKSMWTYCTACGRERDVEPASLNLPGGTPVSGLGKRHMRCSACGSKEIETKPELYPGGIAAQRARHS